MRSYFYTRHCKIEFKLVEVQLQRFVDVNPLVCDGEWVRLYGPGLFLELYISCELHSTGYKYF